MLTVPITLIRWCKADTFRIPTVGQSQSVRQLLAQRYSRHILNKTHTCALAQWLHATVSHESASQSVITTLFST